MPRNRQKYMKMKVSIIIPAYNAEKVIGATLKAYLAHFEFLKKSKKLDYEILVVINNTKDNTEKIVKSWQKKSKSLYYLNFRQGGKGYAVIEGFKDALRRDNDLIGFVDVDMSTKPEEFSRLALQVKDLDGVIASRYLPGAKVSPKPQLKRIILSRLYNLWIRTLFFTPYKDTQCGAKIFRKEAIASVVQSLTITKWAFDVDLLYHLRKKGYGNIKEVPTVWGSSDYSVLGSDFVENGAIMALSLLRLRLINSPFSFIVRFYNNVLPNWMKFHNKIRRSKTS